MARATVFQDSWENSKCLIGNTGMISDLRLLILAVKPNAKADFTGVDASMSKRSSCFSQIWG